MSAETIKAMQDDHFSRWKNREAIAETMIPMIGKLYRERNVIVAVYGRSLVNHSVIQILKSHRRVRMIAGDLSVVDTFPLLSALANLDLGPCVVDIGKLAIDLRDAGGGDIDEFVKKAVAPAVGKKDEGQATDIVLFGFGRIGRMLARLLVEKTGSGNGMRLRAVVVRKTQEGDLQKRASLLRRDSVHGPFDGTIAVDEENEAIIANGNFIKVIYASKPEEVDYTQYGINNAILIDNTGKLKDEEGLGRHLNSKGIARVILTAPAKGAIKNIVYGVNSNTISSDDKILSAASCTTNAITPILKVLDEKYGIVSGHVETVHSFTNDQNLIDNYHKADRRGRSAVLNMVITETGAAKAVAKALPQLQGKLTGNSIRVPTPNVSLAILNLAFPNAVTRDEVNEYMRQVALYSDLQGQIDYTNSTEVVSTDFIGSRSAGVFDAQATIVNGNHATLYVWYDNEMGYSCQVVRIVQQMAGVKYESFPPADTSVH
ncbi:MAG: NADPH-dependent glyceraldehyde-3-phosphate dehydrogenase [Moraxellaceae bacterium]|nr:NADPH-dependent glyceraldehyde-3-phosphate dehydrogenase [Moraxellaceae bacterium]